MKKLLTILLFFAFLGAAPGIQAQQEGDNSIQNSSIYRMHSAVYNRALKYNDPEQATGALYSMCILDPQNDSLLYSLAYLYFEQQKFVSAVMTLNDVIMLNGDNLNAREMKAVALDNLGAKDKALEEYESIYLKNNDINYLHKIAVTQYEMKRYKECVTNINIMLDGASVDELLLLYPDAENNQQEISMRASVLNLRALVEQEQGNKEEARKYYKQALEVSPEFYLCQENLKKLDE